MTVEAGGEFEHFVGRRPYLKFSSREVPSDGSLASLASLPVFWELGSTPQGLDEFCAKQSPAVEIDRYTTERLPGGRSRHLRTLSTIR